MCRLKCYAEYSECCHILFSSMKTLSICDTNRSCIHVEVFTFICKLRSNSYVLIVYRRFRREYQYFGKWWYQSLWERVHMNVYIILNGYQCSAVGIYIHKSIVNGHTYLLHGRESFLRSQLVCSWSRNSPHFTEPEGSLPHSQASATRPYPGPAQSSPYTHIPPPGDPS